MNKYYKIASVYLKICEKTTLIVFNYLIEMFYLHLQNEIENTYFFEINISVCLFVIN